jgi:hypothetical protein
MTEWFPADTKPARVGVYQIKDGFMDMYDWYSYWNGLEWRCAGYTPKEAYHDRLNSHNLNQYQKWRGLSKKP